MADGQTLSLDEVRAIAELAKLDLSEEEVAMYASQLSAILSHFTELQAVDTSQITALASVLPFVNVLRDDQTQTPLTPAQEVANAPDSAEDQFRVSAVLGGE